MRFVSAWSGATAECRLLALHRFRPTLQSLSSCYKEGCKIRATEYFTTNRTIHRNLLIRCPSLDALDMVCVQRRKMTPILRWTTSSFETQDAQSALALHTTAEFALYVDRIGRGMTEHPLSNLAGSSVMRSHWYPCPPRDGRLTVEVLDHRCHI